MIFGAVSITLCVGYLLMLNMIHERPNHHGNSVDGKQERKTRWDS